ncbi:MAG: hypothetical protein AB7N76_13680 [Planctomycetota bacterium]
MLVLTFVLVAVAVLIPHRHPRGWALHDGAARSLREVAAAQLVFRDEDRERDGVQDYGTLKELAQAGLVDEALGRGLKDGYVFLGQPGAPADQIWFAVAIPDPDGEAWGKPSLFVNNTGVVCSRLEPISLAEIVSGCPAPRGCLPLAR